MKKKSILLWIVAIVVLIWTFIPIYWLINMALMFNRELLTFPTHFWPHEPTLSNLVRVVGGSWIGPKGDMLGPAGHSPSIIRGFKNSLIIASAMTIITMFIALPVAYAFGRFTFKFKNTLLFCIIFSRAYPPIALAIPFFYLFRVLDLIGTLRGLVILYMTLTIPMIVWIMMGIFAGFSDDMERVARLDGLTRWQAFYKVFIPMSRSAIAAAAAIAWLTAWNEFTWALIMNSASSAETLGPALSGMFVIVALPAEMTAAGVYAIIPPAIVGLLMQKRIRRLNVVNPV